MIKSIVTGVTRLHIDIRTQKSSYSVGLSKSSQHISIFYGHHRLACILIVHSLQNAESSNFKDWRSEDEDKVHLRSKDEDL